jgi:hypothetical protein
MRKSSLALIIFVLALVVGFMRYRRGLEGFMQKDAGMPLDGPAMGPYDTSMGGWMATEQMPVGNTPQNKSLEQNKLMFLVGNEVRKDCCPSAFTTDSGCVCLSQSDRDLMASRGGNK